VKRAKPVEVRSMEGLGVVVCSARNSLGKAATVSGEGDPFAFIEASVHDCHCDEQASAMSLTLRVSTAYR
jgi:hypothetical protein